MYTPSSIVREKGDNDDDNDGLLLVYVCVCVFSFREMNLYRYIERGDDIGGQNSGRGNNFRSEFSQPTGFELEKLRYIDLFAVRATRCFVSFSLSHYLTRVCVYARMRMKIG